MRINRLENLDILATGLSAKAATKIPPPRPDVQCYSINKEDDRPLINTEWCYCLAFNASDWLPWQLWLYITTVAMAVCRADGQEAKERCLHPKLLGMSNKASEERVRSGMFGLGMMYVGRWCVATLDVKIPMTSIHPSYNLPLKTKFDWQ